MANDIFFDSQVLDSVETYFSNTYGAVGDAGLVVDEATKKGFYYMPGGFVFQFGYVPHQEADVEVLFTTPFLELGGVQLTRVITSTEESERGGMEITGLSPAGFTCDIAISGTYKDPYFYLAYGLVKPINPAHVDPATRHYDAQFTSHKTIIVDKPTAWDVNGLRYQVDVEANLEHAHNPVIPTASHRAYIKLPGGFGFNFGANYSAGSGVGSLHVLYDNTAIPAAIPEGGKQFTKCYGIQANRFHSLNASASGGCGISNFLPTVEDGFTFDPSMGPGGKDEVVFTSYGFF